MTAAKSTWRRCGVDAETRGPAVLVGEPGSLDQPLLGQQPRTGLSRRRAGSFSIKATRAPTCASRRRNAPARRAPTDYHEVIHRRFPIRIKEFESPPIQPTRGCPLACRKLQYTLCVLHLSVVVVSCKSVDSSKLRVPALLLPISPRTVLHAQESRHLLARRLSGQAERVGPAQSREATAQLVAALRKARAIALPGRGLPHPPRRVDRQARARSTTR